MNRILSEGEVDEIEAAKRRRLEAENWKAINPNWKLVDPLTVEQAAALIAGVDPLVVRFNSNGEAWFENEGLRDSDGIKWVTTSFAALVNAINARKLKAMLQYDAEPRYMAGIDILYERSYWRNEEVQEVAGQCPDEDKTFVIGRDPNWSRSTVSRGDLVPWLEAAGIHTGFFFPDETTDTADYLDPKNPRYAPKLAAAVRAWQSVTDTGGKHPKQALMKWLREHASFFGMTDEDGKLNEYGIEEVAKVANWQPGGGAPKTPVE